MFQDFIKLYLFIDIPTHISIIILIAQIFYQNPNSIRKLFVHFFQICTSFI